MGTVKLSDNVKLYEQVGRGTLTEIELEDITRNTVPADLITYVRKDYNGDADIVVFNDVTGDRYTYGFSETSTKNVGEFAIPTPAIAVENAMDTTDPVIYTKGESFRNDRAIGIVHGPKRTDGEVVLENHVELLSADVRSSDFDVDAMTVTTSSMVLPISDRVMCYNETTEEWFPVGEGQSDEDFVNALNLARAFSDSATIYYDKAPDQGGKVRLVVVG